MRDPKLPVSDLTVTGRFRLESYVDDDGIPEVMSAFQPKGGRIVMRPGIEIALAQFAAHLREIEGGMLADAMDQVKEVKNDG